LHLYVYVHCDREKERQREREIKREWTFMKFDACKETFAHTGLCIYTLRLREKGTEKEREKERVDDYEI